MIGAAESAAVTAAVAAAAAAIAAPVRATLRRDADQPIGSHLVGLLHDLQKVACQNAVLKKQINIHLIFYLPNGFLLYSTPIFLGESMGEK